MVNIIVITHGKFGEYLVEAAEEIVGPQPTGVRCISISSRLSVEEARGMLESAVAELRGGEGLIVAVDMPGGTPCNIAMRVVRDRPDVRVICGINLYMMVTAFGRRGACGVDEVFSGMLDSGRKAIVDMRARIAEAGT
ncbi:MAG: hypothetical protein WCU88_07660 [Elusimicrobiota bacterium]|jgi:mannose/fructose-specific phosphotransferase system component IIA